MSNGTDYPFRYTLESYIPGLSLMETLHHECPYSRSVASYDVSEDLIADHNALAGSRLHELDRPEHT